MPYRISGNMTASVALGGSATVTIEVVRRQAKVEPPLSSLAGGGGPFVLTMFAQVTVHGRTISGQTTNAAVGRVQIDFADFGDTQTSCPTLGSLGSGYMKRDSRSKTSTRHWPTVGALALIFAMNGCGLD